jgi:hypothetical protein
MELFDMWHGRQAYISHSSAGGKSPQENFFLIHEPPSKRLLSPAEHHAEMKRLGLV